MLRRSERGSSRKVGFKIYEHKNGCSFRKLSRKDLSLLKRLKEDSWTTTHRTAFVNEDDQDEWFDSIPNNTHHFICFFQKPHPMPRYEGETTPEELGLLTIAITDSISRVGQIGGSIFAKYRGTEWAKKAWEAGTDFAFEMLNLHRIDGEVLENNVAALAMDVNLGYTIEGKRRRAVYKSGTYLDSYIVGYLRDAWEVSVMRRYQGVCNTNFKSRVASEKVLERLGVELPAEINYETLVAAQPVKNNRNGLSDEEIRQIVQSVS